MDSVRGHFVHREKPDSLLPVSITAAYIEDASSFHISTHKKEFKEEITQREIKISLLYEQRRE